MMKAETTKYFVCITYVGIIYITIIAQKKGQGIELHDNKVSVFYWN